MRSGSRGYDHGSCNSGAYDSRSNGYHNGSYNPGGSHGNRNPALVPAYADTTSRRRRMNIEDMLNPSEENPRRYEQPQSSKSYEAGRTGSGNPGSPQDIRAPRSVPHSHGANASARSRGGCRPPPRGSGSPDIPSQTRHFRPGYTGEQEHFIWYLRIDTASKPSLKQAMLTSKRVSSVGILGLTSSTLTMLASLIVEKGDAESPDSNVNFIGSPKPTAYRM